MSKAQVRVLVVALVSLAVFTAVVIYRHSLVHREILLFTVKFEIGTPRAEVVATLGTPDQELTGAELQKYAAVSNSACHAAMNVLRYFSPGRGGGAFCWVYLDAEGRVVCVEHGMIAI